MTTRHMTAAAVIGFLGNELVAIFRIRVGREIGSAALEADGLHARTDGLTSLAVLVGAVGVWLGFPRADPIVGLLITIPILLVVRDAAKAVWERLMDAVDPNVVDTVERTARTVAGALAIHDVRVRWLGHNLEAELHADVDSQITTAAGICAVLDLHVAGRLSRRGLVRQEQVRLEDFLANRFGEYYESRTATRFSSGVVGEEQ